MLKLVGPDPDKVLGCTLYFTDTAFFEEGKVTEIVKTDKDGFLIAQKFGDNKIGIQDIRTTFSTIVRERRKELSAD